MKFAFVILIAVWMLSSCTVTRPQTTFVIEKEVQAVMDSIAVSNNTDTSKVTIIMYNVNVIVPEQPKQGMSNENQRLLITGFFGSLSTIFAIIFVSNDSQ